MGCLPNKQVYKRLVADSQKVYKLVGHKRVVVEVVVERKRVENVWFVVEVVVERKWVENVWFVAKVVASKRVANVRFVVVEVANVWFVVWPQRGCRPEQACTFERCCLD